MPSPQGQALRARNLQDVICAEFQLLPKRLFPIEAVPLDDYTTLDLG